MYKRLKYICIGVFLTVSSSSFPQSSGYTQRNNQIYFCNELIEQADFASFRFLGHGYAKDKNNVYYKGDLLRFVDPNAFKLKGKKGEVTEDSQDGGYYKAEDDVFYNGKKVKGVFTVRDFKDLGDGYAIDTFDAYYKGVKIEGAHASGFKNLGKGYAKDSFHTYFYGKKTE